MTDPVVMATVIEGINRNSPLDWSVSAFMVLAGLFFIRVGYRFFAEGPTVKTVIGTFSIRAQSRLGFVARASLVCAGGGGGIVLGLVAMTTMLWGWP
jgi:hypothetical protein